MLTHRVPYPPDRGDRIRAYHLLKQVSTRFDVTLAAIADEPVTSATLAELERFASQVLLVEARLIRRRAAAARAMILGQAITPAAMLDTKLANQLIQLHAHQPFDTVLTYCTGMVGYTRALRDTPGSQPFRHVLDMVDVDSQKWANFAEQTNGPMRLVYAAEARRLRSVEAGQAVDFDAITVISDAEAERYRDAVTATHSPIVVGNGVDLERFYPAAPQVQENTPPRIVFTGVMSYKPNIDAVTWFARKVMPRITAAIPQASFAIVGKSPTPGVIALGELPGIEVVGPVEDTAEQLRGASLAVAPMQIAPGVQNKVLEAMACGLAVVCTSAAAAGIDAQPGRDLLIADREADTAAHCVRLLTHPGYRIEVGQDARRRVEQRYHWAAAMTPMLGLLEPTRPQETAPHV